MQDTAAFQVELIREAFSYQSRFNGSTMVFKIDFPVTEDPGFPLLMGDLALLSRTGFRVVIVPGAKERIDSVLREYGIVSSYTRTADDGPLTRITTGAAMSFVEMAAFHAATCFMTGLSADRVDAVIGNFVRARGLGVLDGLDMENTGAVDKIFTDSLNRALNLGMVPILPCIGWSSTGRAYNVPSDEIALAASVALKAVKLFIISLHGGPRGYTVPGTIAADDTGRIIRLTPQEAAAVLEANNAVGKAGQDRPLDELGLALRASKAGVERVHIIDGREPGAVLRELFSNIGAGTMIYADAYESIRSLDESDIPAVLGLMEPLMRQGILIRRSVEDIQGKRKDYAVFEIDGSVHACGALHEWGEHQGEIAAVATDPAYADMGLGSRIVRCLINRAVNLGLRRVFVLTTRTQDWFESLGFKECTVESLPEQRRKRYDRNRKSKVFALDI